MKSIEKYGDTLRALSKFVKELDESVRVDAFKFLLDAEVAHTETPVLPNVVASPRDSAARTLAPQELIRSTGVSTFTEKAVVLAYWLEEFQQRPTFSSGDLKGAFEQAREQSPKNPSDLVAKLEATARIMKADKNGSVQNYRLTSTAIQDVERWIKGGPSENEA